VPDVRKESPRKILQFSGAEQSTIDIVVEGMIGVTSYRLGYPSATAISNYYPGDRISREEIAVVGKSMQEHGIEPENTRVRKGLKGGKVVYEVHQASSDTDSPEPIAADMLACSNVRIVRGDHTAEMPAICTQ
jgi:hypothetical protein